MSCFLLFLERIVNIKKPEYALKFGYKIKESRKYKDYIRKLRGLGVRNGSTNDFHHPAYKQLNLQILFQKGEKIYDQQNFN